LANDVLWPVPVLAIHGNNHYERHKERQESDRNRSFSN